MHRIHIIYPGGRNRPVFFSFLSHYLAIRREETRRRKRREAATKKHLRNLNPAKGFTRNQNKTEYKLPHT